MAKITLNDVGSLIDATTAKNTINANNAAIEAAFENTFSRDGTAPNQILDDVDVNSKQILNLPQPATANSPLRLQDLSAFVGGGTVTNIPPGGTLGQPLSKTSSTNYAVGWNTVTGSGSSVLATAPTLTTPNIGAATGTSLVAGVDLVPSLPSRITVANSSGLSAMAVGQDATHNLNTVWGYNATPANASAAIGTFGYTNPLSIDASAVTIQGASGGALTLNNSGAAPTGTGAYVRATTPTLVTPVIGAATATSVNKVAITAPATSATLTIANGATLSVPSSATVSGTSSGTNTGDQTITLTSDVTGTGVGSFATTIAANAVTNAKAAQMAAFTLKGNATGSTANATDISIPALTQKTTPVAADKLLIADSAASNALKYVTMSSIVLVNGITVQSFLTGSGTYTTPAGVKWIRIRAVGAGGGGGGSGTASVGNGATGGNTTFGTTLIAANGGAGGQGALGSPGALGGTASLGTGPIGIAVQGGGGGGTSQNSTASYLTVAAWGGNSALGGGGAGALNSPGVSGTANTGGGGSSAGPVNGTVVIVGAGGASGGFVDAIINSPLATYAYSVGAGGTAGTAGTSGFAGGTGGSGGVWVEEHYNW